MLDICFTKSEFDEENYFMNLKIVGMQGDIPFEITSDEIECLIENHSSANIFLDVILEDYLLDEAGNIEGIKGRVDLGHGYGFNYGWKDFCIKIGETYSYSHSYTSIEGPSDWVNGEIKVTFQLLLSE